MLVDYQLPSISLLVANGRLPSKLWRVAKVALYMMIIYHIPLQHDPEDYHLS